MMSQTRDSSAVALALLLSLVSAPGPLAESIIIFPVLAQSPPSSPASFPLPSAVPTGTTVRIDGSSSMLTINQELEQRFETQYPGTQVNAAYSGTDAALQAVRDGTIDLAAIGRSLTDAEKAQGLVEVPIARHKIAMIVGPDNPFTGSLTSEQFAQIFRGQVTDWSEVGGASGAIRMIDRPEISDTRQAFRNYPVFKAAPFMSGAEVERLPDDSTDSIIQELDNDGVSYAIADQVMNRQDVRVVSMHKTLPTDPRYPFSQPLVYVYRGPTPNPAVQAFLGVATAPANQPAIEAARQAGAIEAAAGTLPSPGVTASPGATPSPTATPTSGATTSPVAPATPDTTAVAPVAGNGGATTPGDVDGGVPPWLWWLLPLALLGGLLAWWLTRRRPDGEVVEPPVPLPSPAVDGGVAPAPVPPPGADATAPDNTVAARAGSVISSDRLSIGGDRPPIIPPPSPTVASPPEIAPDGPPVNIPAPGADAGLDIPAMGGAAIAGGAMLAAGVGAAALGALASDGPTARSHITLAPHTHKEAYAQWDAPEAHKAELRQQGGQQLALRLYDVTGVDPAEPNLFNFQQYDCAEQEESRFVPIPAGDRDYLAEIGYWATDGRWLSLARSNPIHVLSTTEDVPESDGAELVPETPPLGDSAAGAAVVAGLGVVALASLSSDDDQSTVEAAKFDVGQTDLSTEALATVDEGLPDLPEGYGESRIVLLPRDPQWAYAYWDVPHDHKEELRRQGGERLTLRFYDVTDIDLNSQNPHSLQQYDCEEMARDWYIPVPVSDRDYIVEIGYLAADGRWLMLARSAPARIPPIYPSDWAEEQFITLPWDEDLRGKTFLTLIPPSQRVAAESNPIYDAIFDMVQSAEAQRVAGSLYGSMQMVPEQAISSYVFPSGVGMVPTLSMSGIGMSGVGFSASLPLIRPRKFWLVADAELIVYGATEPDATVTIGGRPIQLSPDGTFRFQMSFQDGVIDYPILAVAADGEQNRSIHMTFTRETPDRRTNTKDEAIDEWLS